MESVPMTDGSDWPNTDPELSNCSRKTWGAWFSKGGWVLLHDFLVILSMPPVV